MRVLVADDDRLCRLMLEDALGEWGHDVVTAEDGDAAWALFLDDPTIALVVTDWVMPGLTGPELCERIRGLNRSPYVPILLSTSQRESEHLIEALSAGADAFLPKPLAPAILEAQLRVAERMIGLEERLNAKIEGLEAANQRIRADLEAAAVVQKSHLPTHAPQVPMVEFAWVYDACQKLGGDMFNLFRLDEEHVGAYVLDVSGHGTSAALLSVSLSRALVPDPQQGGILKRKIPDTPFYEIVPPAEVAKELNRRFQLIEEAGRFCTFLYGVLNLRTRCFRYVSAGHPAPIEVSSGVRMSESTGGVPIGVLPDPDYPEAELQLSAGSQLYLYTDGVSEARSKEGEEFGTERILDVLGDPSVTQPSSVSNTVVRLQRSIEDFAEGEAPRDDVTILALGII